MHKKMFTIVEHVERVVCYTSTFYKTKTRIVRVLNEDWALDIVVTSVAAGLALTYAECG